MSGGATWAALLASWSWEPYPLAGLILAAVLYALGLRRRGRRGAIVPAWRIACYYAGLLSIALALLSPISVFSGLLFLMHMIQHMLLSMVGAPLILLGAPTLPLLWTLPGPARRLVGRLLAGASPLRRAFRWLTRPLAASTLYAATLWIWHLPALYDASLRSDALHYLQHALFFGTALLFWWPVIRPVPGRPSRADPMLLFYLFLSAMQSTLLGIVITFTREPLYPHYTRVPRVWGIPPLADQQIAGGVMMFGDLIYFVAMALVLYEIVDSE